MKRTALVRRTPLRATRIQRVSAKRAAALAADQRDRVRDTGPSRTVLAQVKARSGDVCEFASCISAAEHTHARHHEWIETHRADAYLLGLLLHQHQIPACVPVTTRHAVDPVWLDGTDGWAPYAEVVAP